MPTPAGKPKVGEWIVTREGVRGKVVRRSDGPGYSVWVMWPQGIRIGTYRDSQGVSIITEFDYWMRRNNWRIET